MLHAACVIPPADPADSATDVLTCACGKQCKGRRGLAAHRRHCSALQDDSTVTDPGQLRPDDHSKSHPTVSQPTGLSLSTSSSDDRPTTGAPLTASPQPTTTGIRATALRCSARAATKSLLQAPALSASTTEACICGRLCKGLRGLAAHQRCCTTYNTLVDGGLITGESLGKPVVTSSGVTEQTALSFAEDLTLEYTDSICSGNSCLLDGVRLPKAKSDWNEANAYFHCCLNDYLSGPISDLDLAMETINYLRLFQE